MQLPPPTFVHCMSPEVARPGSAGHRVTGPISQEVLPRQRCAVRSQSDPIRTNQKYTVNLVPRPLSPGRIFNVPRICSTSASTIVIPRPLECAGLNPDGTPGPSSRTDSELTGAAGVPPIRTMMLPRACFAAFVTSSVTMNPRGIAVAVCISIVVVVPSTEMVWPFLASSNSRPERSSHRIPAKTGDNGAAQDSRH
jgi:hypothetical protein